MLAFDPQHRIKPEEALRHPFITSTEHQHNEYEGQPHHPDQLQSQQMGHAYGE
jgi:hypothetical protein